MFHRETRVRNPSVLCAVHGPGRRINVLQGGAPHLDKKSRLHCNIYVSITAIKGSLLDVATKDVTSHGNTLTLKTVGAGPPAVSAHNFTVMMPCSETYGRQANPSPGYVDGVAMTAIPMRASGTRAVPAMH